MKQNGSRKRFLEYVQKAAVEGDGSAKAFWEDFSARCRFEQQTVSFDAVCAAAGVSPSELTAAVVASGMGLAEAHTRDRSTQRASWTSHLNPVS